MTELYRDDWEDWDPKVHGPMIDCRYGDEPRWPALIVYLNHDLLAGLMHRAGEEGTPPTEFLTRVLEREFGGTGTDFEAPASDDYEAENAFIYAFCGREPEKSPSRNRLNW